MLRLDYYESVKADISKLRALAAGEGTSKLSLLASASASEIPASADKLTSRASVIDGDTLEIHGRRIRLWALMRPKPP